MPQLKRIPGLSIKLLLVIGFSFLFLEFLLLVFNDLVFRNSFYIYDPDLGYRVRSYTRWGKNITNEFGFNDRDYPHQRTPGTFRILFLGDSFSWAGGLEGNYTAILERKFEPEFGDQRVEIINAGYSGTHTGEQLNALKKFALQYQPDLVVLGFFVGNDFLDADPWRKRVVIGGATTDLDTRKDWEITLFGQLVVPQSRFYLFLKQQWATYQYLQTHRQKNEVQQPGQKSPARSGQTDAFTYTEKNISNTYLDYEFRRMQIANWSLASYAADEFAIYENFAFENLLAMRDLLAENNIKFIVAAYPDEIQVDESLRQVVMTHYKVDPTHYQLDRPQGRLWQFCQEHQIEFYDLLPTFQEAYRQGQHLYIPNDSHWNGAGNELAAQYLYEILVWKAREYLN
jgi:hypothetical protein